MKRITWLFALLCVAVLTFTVAAAPVASGSVTLTPDTLTGAVVTANGNGSYSITAPGGKIPVAVSADGKTAYVAQSAAATTSKAPVTNYVLNQYKDYITYGAPLTHTYKKITQDKQITVLYFGGSVTQGYGSQINGGGWRGHSEKWFGREFPGVDFNCINSGLGESGTFMGTYRVQTDVIAQKPDLVFLEYAINDRYKGATKEQAAAQYETIVREIKQALPECDIVTLLVTDSGVAPMLPELFPQAAGHAEVAKKYNIPVVNVGAALVNHMNDYTDQAEWSTYFLDGVHPIDAGYAVYFECLKEYLTNMLKHTDYSGVTETVNPLIPVQSTYLLDGDRKSVFGKDMEQYIVADQSKGFRYNSATFKPSSSNDLPHTGYYYSLYSSNSNAKITFKFTGTELAIWTNFYNTSTIRYSVDGGAFRTMSCARHAPTQVVSNLPAGEHTVTIEPVTYGAEASRKMEIGAIFIRDASKQTVKGDRGYYVGENKFTLKLPAGNYTLKYVDGTATAAALPTPAVGADKVVTGWKNQNGTVVTDTRLKEGAVLTVVTADKAQATTTTTTTTTTVVSTGGTTAVTPPVNTTTVSVSGETTVTGTVTTVADVTETTTVSGGETTVSGGETTTAAQTATTAVAAGTDTTTPSDNGGQFPTGLVIGLAVAAVVVIGGAVVTVIVFKKKKEQ